MCDKPLQQANILYAKERAARATGLLQMSIDPKQYKTAPASPFSLPTFTQILQYNCTFQTKDDSAFPVNSEKVPTQSGFIMWLHGWGCDNMFRMGIIPQGATSVYTPGGTNYGLANEYNWNGVSAYANGCGGIASIEYISPCAVPYGKDVSGDQIIVAPNLAENISKARLYGGYLALYSDTRSTDQTTLAGTVTLAPIADTRDISRTNANTPTVPGKCYDTTDIEIAATLSNEVVKSIPINDGVVSVLGSDIALEFGPPRRQQTDELSSDFVAIQVQVPTVVNEMVSPIPVSPAWPGIGAFLYEFGGWPLWFTPWDTQCELITNTALYSTAPGSGAGTQRCYRILTNPIDETGCLDVTLFWKATVQASSNAFAQPPAPNTYEVGMLATHVFARTTSDQGRVLYVTTSERHVYSVKTEFSATVYFNDNIDTNGSLRTDLRPRMLSFGFAETGKYIGTACIPYVRNVFPQSANNAVNHYRAVFQANPLALVRARSVNGPGRLTARILKYEGITKDQQVRVDGFGLIQARPSAQIATFTQESVAWAPEAFDVNALTMLTQLYSGVTPVKRNHTRTDYLILRERVSQMSQSQLIDWAIGEPTGRVGVAMQAAGIFGDILTGILPGIVGAGAKMLTGGACGQFAGSGAAAGQMRAYNAAGQMRAANAAGQIRARNAAGLFGNDAFAYTPPVVSGLGMPSANTMESAIIRSQLMPNRNW